MKRVVVDIDEEEKDGKHHSEINKMSMPWAGFKVAGMLEQGSSGCVGLCYRKRSRDEIDDSGNGDRDLDGNSSLEIKQLDDQEILKELNTESNENNNHNNVGKCLYEELAVKVIAKDQGEKIIKQALVEIDVLKRIKGIRCCPFLVDCNFCCESLDSYYIGLEYCPGGDLFNILYSETGFNDTQSYIPIYAAEIALGLGFLHENSIIHCDIKPENIVFGRDGHVRLIDFGLAVILDVEKDLNPSTNRLEKVTDSGTLGYCDPQVLTRVPHSFESDWWSFGVLLYEMYVGALPWFDESPEVTCDHICNSPVSFPESDCGKAYVPFVNLLLQKRPCRRLGFHGLNEIQQHSFFEHFDWATILEKGYELPLEGTTYYDDQTRSSDDQDLIDLKESENIISLVT